MNGLKQYSAAAAETLDQVSLESRALIRTASTLNAIKENWEARQPELAEALERNRKLWTIIASAMQDEDCPQPREIRSNIINLALFVFKKTIAIIAEPKPESLGILININMNIAKGLAEHPEETKLEPVP